MARAARAGPRRAADEDPVGFQAAVALDALKFLSGAGWSAVGKVLGRIFGDEVFVREVPGHRRGFPVVGEESIVCFNDVLPHTMLLPHGTVGRLPHLKSHPTTGIEAAKRSRGAEVPHLARHSAQDVEDRFAPSVLSRW